MRSLSKMLLVFSAIAVILSFGVQQAKADALLFPYFKSGGGAYTFISLYNPFSPNDPTVLQVVYYYGDDCIHENHKGQLTNFDLNQFEVTNQIDLDALFGDAGTGTPVNLLVSPSEGFLIVSLEGQFEANHGGQAAIIDTINGTVSTYKALNNPFSTVAGDWGGVLTSKGSFDMTSYPDITVNPNYVSTQWFVLATGDNMFNAVPSWTGAVTLSNAADLVYDRDEAFVSGDKLKTVTCFDTITREDIMTAGQVIQSDNGGYWWENVAATLPATGALMYKIETTTAFGTSLTAISSENAFPNWPY